MTITVSGQQLVYHGDKTEIEALTDLAVDTHAQTNDTHEFGWWDGSDWHWSAESGGGDVIGNGSITDGHLAVFDSDVHHIKDGGAVPAGGGDVSRSGSTTDGHLAVWNGTDASSIKEGGAIPTIASNTVTDSGSITAGHVAIFDSTAHVIKDGGAPGGTGTVSDTGATTANHLAIWNGASDHILKDGGAIPSISGLVTGNVSVTDGHLAVFDTDGYHIKDGGALPATPLYPWLIGINPLITPYAQTNWSTYNFTDTGAKMPYLQSSGAQNAQLTYEVLLGAGTWTIEFLTIKNTNNGIATLALDGSSIGTIDWYNGSALYQARSSLTGISVATSGVKSFTITMASKGSGSSYYGQIHWIQFIRTA